MQIDLTKEELQFLQRLVGHHLVGNSGPMELYGKLARTAEILRVYSDKPLPLYTVKSVCGKRLFFRVATKEWVDYDVH